MTADRELASWAAYVVTASLDGTPAPPLPPGCTSHAAVRLLQRHRVIGTVAAAAETIGLDDEVAQLAAGARARLLLAGLGNAADTALASTALTRAGVEHLVVKGVAIPAVLGRSPAERGPGDVDLWVRPADLRAAEEALAAHGWRRRATAPTVQPGDGWRWRLTEHALHEVPLDHPDRSTADLHWRLTGDPGELGFGFDDAYAASVAIPAVGATVRTLAPVHALEHVAQHGRKEAWHTLRHLLDVLALAEAVGPETTGRLAAERPNVRLAMATAAHLDPQLIRGMHVDATTARGAAAAWQLCLDHERNPGFRRERHGVGAAAAKLRRTGWRFRSAPDGRSRSRLVLLLATRPARRVAWATAGQPTPDTPAVPR